jgi:alkylhydroperoxidase/carboxymuconolactone decarboxylase family protein YurZ
MTILPSQIAKLASSASKAGLSKYWYFLAATPYASCNRPEATASIFNYIKNSTPETEWNDVLSKMKEAVMKGVALYGMPKAINALVELRKVTPPDLVQTKPLRDFYSPDLKARGEKMYWQTYGQNGDFTRNLVSDAYPDLFLYGVHSVYVHLISFNKVLDPKETSFTVVSALIPQDCNAQLYGHLQGCINNGATPDEVDSVRTMAITISDWCGIERREPVLKLGQKYF